MTRPRRRTAALALLAATALAVTACGAGGGTGNRNALAGAAKHPIRIGLITALSGNNQIIGVDVRDGFQLYLDTHGGRLGGHPVQLTITDEGDDPKPAAAVAQRMIDDGALALVGGVGANTVTAVAPLTAKARIPFLGANSRPDLPDISHVWTTSFVSEDFGTAVGPYIKTNAGGPVFAIGPDSLGGHNQVRGFTDSFKAAGGVLANPGGSATFAPQPTTDFTAYFAKIKASNAKAVYCFFSGDMAVAFVKQYSQSQVSNIPLYAAGFVTEGAALRAEGAAAANVYSVMNYAPDTESTTNRVFVAEWGTRHSGQQPTAFAAAAYDAAAVLDRAITATNTADPTPEQVNSAIGELGELDSPRGVWQFGPVTHAPIQKWYLRKVQRDGTTWANVRILDLATLGK